MCQGWEDAGKMVRKCLIHPDRNCKISYNGTYKRKFPFGTLITRFLCHTEGVTFSLLPDCFSSRMPGTLIEVEEIVLAAESEPSIYSAAKALPKHIEFMGAYRWIQRRVNFVRASLLMLIEIFPDLFGDCSPTIASFQLILGKGKVLTSLRNIAEGKLHRLLGKRAGKRSQDEKCTSCSDKINGKNDSSAIPGS
ncbi:hypothetical protein QUF76_13580 [Desulfobacterales bacterium HSG16]|nr:hypothetical protein [Desulfobacterales bacterium HSG16]